MKVEGPEEVDARQRREAERILRETERRRREVPPDRYAPWNPAEQFLLTGRRRLAARLLHAAGCFPGPGRRCLEVGCGEGGWLPELIGWGVPEGDLSGIELDPERLAVARRRLPAADLRAGDAAALPWDDGRFDLVVVSTVFTSVLDELVRHRLAAEVRRVLAPGGALLWYDFAFDNPRNPQVRRVSRRQLAELFPDLVGEVRRVSLAPPIARRVAPRSWWLATTLELLPWLRSHLLAVLVKAPEGP